MKDNNSQENPEEFFEELIIKFTKAIEMNPDDEVSYCNRGSVKFRSQDLKGAIDDWELGVKLGCEISAGFLEKYKHTNS